MTFLSGLKEFIESWEDRFVEPTELDRVRESPQGNINSEGTSACGDSPTFPKYHRYFKKSLEPGVRELAIALIQKFDCITYSSCQGHFSTPDAAMRPRYVAILPRNEEEYQRLFNILNHLAKLTNSLVPNSAVTVAIGEDRVESEECVMSGLTLFFVSTTSNEEIYFQEVEIVSKKVVELIASH